MDVIKKMAYWGGLIGGTLYVVKFALYVYKNKTNISVDGLINL